MDGGAFPLSGAARPDLPPHSEIQAPNRLRHFGRDRSIGGYLPANFAGLERLRPVDGIAKGAQAVRHAARPYQVPHAHHDDGAPAAP